MKIFLSYSSKDQNAVEPIYYELLNSGHEVFIDRKSLLPSEEFNTAIRKSVQKSDLFIFIITPDSIEKSAYTHTELRFAEEKWPHPKGHVLPVMLHPTDYALIPNYLKAINIMESKGNMAAEIGAWVAEKQQTKRKKQLLYVAVPLLAAMALAAVLLVKYITPASTPPTQGNTNASAPAKSLQGNKHIPYLQTFDGSDNEIPGIWRDRDEHIWSSHIDNGRYCLKNTTGSNNVDYTWLMLQQPNNPQDMRISVDVELADIDYYSPLSSAGLVYSFNKNTSYYYAFTIAPDGVFYLYKKNANGFDRVYSAAYATTFISSKKTLAMQKRDGSLELYIDDKLVKSIQDDELPSGEYGLAGVSTGTYCFDNFSVNLPE